MLWKGRKQEKNEECDQLLVFIFLQEKMHGSTVNVLVGPIHY